MYRYSVRRHALCMRKGWIELVCMCIVPRTETFCLKSTLSSLKNIISVYVCVYAYATTNMCVWGSDDNFVELDLSFWDCIRVTRLIQQVLSHQATSLAFSLFFFQAWFCCVALAGFELMAILLS